MIYVYVYHWYVRQRPLETLQSFSESQQLPVVLPMDTRDKVYIILRKEDFNWEIWV